MEMNDMKEEKRNQVIYFSNNTCVSCGKTIPEGHMVCKYCMDKEERKEIEKHIVNKKTSG